MSHNLFIKELSRITVEGEIETLTFDTGVNLIIGNSNSGKTVWLKMLDYVLGDRGTIEDALGAETGLVSKYRAIRLVIKIGDTEILLERDWHTPGNKGKIKVGEEVYVSVNDFSAWLLDHLKIPNLNFPKGNPYLKSWIELSFRMMYRHIYRQERFWSDIADKQPDFEQFAVLSQFLGFADKLYSQSFDSSINKSKELLKLQSKKEQFEQILDGLARSMTGKEDANRIQFATRSEVDSAITNLKIETEVLLKSRESIIGEQIEKIKDTKKQRESLELEILKRRTALLHEAEATDRTRGELEERIKSFESILNKVDNEVEKLGRSKVSGIISDLKITHCPACDQEISAQETDSGECFLCHRHTVTNNQRYEERMEFEVHQLNSEKKELHEIISKYNSDLKPLEQQRQFIGEQLHLIDRQLRPLRQELSALTDERVSFIDTERGRIEEKIENYKRLLENFDLKENIIKDIDDLTSEINSFEAQAETLSNQINYEAISSALEDGMNGYINELMRQNHSVWPHGKIHFEINERRFRIKVGDMIWTSVSALYQEYVLLAYHYALLTLSNDLQFNYPGILIMDFPPQLGEEKMKLDTLDYIIKPFINFCKNPENGNVQVILAGKTISDLPDTHINTLTNIWISLDNN